MSEIQSLKSETQSFKDSISHWNTWNIGFITLAFVAAGGLVITSFVLNRKNANLEDSRDHLDALVEREARAESQAMELRIANAQTEAGGAQTKAGLATAEAAKANERAEQLKAQNLATETRLEQERSQRADLEAANAPRIMEQLQSMKDLEPFHGTSVIIEGIAESEPWRMAGQIAFALDGAKWNVLPGMKRYLDSSGFFDGVAVEMNVGARTDTARAAAEALVAVLKRNNIDANTRPAYPELPPNTLRIRVGLKPDRYFSRDRKDLMYENMLYK